MENISLSELNKLIKDTLEKNLEPSYWVVAEIGELRENTKGHCYLELVEKDDNQVLAKSRATIWSYTYRNISGWFQKITGSELQAGMKILANVQVSFHEVYGFNLNIKDIDATFTLGEREKRRQETIAKLEKDGVMDMNKHLSLPHVPDSIAVISSPTAAGLGDFIDQLENNVFGYRIKFQLYPAIMQGPDAPGSIINSLHQIVEAHEDHQLIVLIRGGGAAMDLDCFDDYELASHLAQVPLPVITGIGHERDSTISDMVAHTSLKTPTAVAEFLINGLSSFEAQLEDTFNRIGQIANDRISQEKIFMANIISSLKLRSNSVLREHLNGLNAALDKVRILSKLLVSGEKTKISSLESKVNLLDPHKILNKGYTYTSSNGKSIAKLNLKKGDQLETYSEENIIISKVEKIEKYGKD